MPRCKSCGANILWIRTAQFKKMPLDAKPVTGYRLVGGQAEFEKIHTPHFATCPNAKKHRKKKENN